MSLSIFNVKHTFIKTPIISVGARNDPRRTGAVSSEPLAELATGPESDTHRVTPKMD